MAISNNNNGEGDASDIAASSTETRLSDSLSLGRHTVTFAVSAEMARCDHEGNDVTRQRVSPAALRAGVRSIQNTRQDMEDAHCTVIPEATMLKTLSGNKILTVDDERAKKEPVLLGFFGVFDGHGGKRAAEFAEAKLYEAFMRRLENKSDAQAWSPEDEMSAVRAAFLETEESLLEISKEQEWMDGTTAAVAIVVREKGGQRALIAGNVGDSEILLGRREANGPGEHEVLSEVHNMAKNQAERARVEAEGGRVFGTRLGHPRFNPRFASLAVSRALGDLFFKDPELTENKVSALSAEPFLIRREVTELDRFVLLGCDGFFDTVDYGEAVDFTFSCLDAGNNPEDASGALVELAKRKGSTDNITVLLVEL
eukprot:TRINITY_DN73942_c0_g1_i1.p1 TRINITY_DN73942_c0_g1~~TRINITY_DN73942_c0_g1_i1.p1  ORF type:complete len:418 (-),score=76.85 TRINITY_DN73942_c0_g1_i1:349-1458(-)